LMLIDGHLRTETLPKRSLRCLPLHGSPSRLACSKVAGRRHHR
jgi:hypothetical protein